MVKGGSVVEENEITEFARELYCKHYNYPFSEVAFESLGGWVRKRWFNTAKWIIDTKIKPTNI